MPRWGGGEHETNSRTHDGGFGRQLLLIPEAPVLIALLLIGWAYHFSNGLTFGVMYTAMIGEGTRRHWGWPCSSLIARTTWAPPCGCAPALA